MMLSEEQCGVGSTLMTRNGPTREGGWPQYESRPLGKVTAHPPVVCCVDLVQDEPASGREVDCTRVQGYLAHKKRF